MSQSLTLRLDLPQPYYLPELIAFHRRDPQSLAESVTLEADAVILRKGLVWHGAPASLLLHLNTQMVECQLSVDASVEPLDAAELRERVQRLLGLQQPVQAFEQRFASHPQLGPLLRAQAGLRVPQTASVFEALSWAITGQQISVAAAVALRRKLIQAAGPVHSSGLACYPEAEQVQALGVEGLRRLGFSHAKAACLQRISEALMAGTLMLPTQPTPEQVEAFRHTLLAVKGIGPWTVNYTLLRGLGWLDGTLEGDAGVRRALQGVLCQAEPLDVEATRRWLQPFAPWRALVAAHLWAWPGSTC